MKMYHVLMADSTAHTIDMVFRSGAVLAEVGSLPQISFDDLHFPDEPYRQNGV